MTEQHIQFMLSKIPMDRFGEVEEWPRCGLACMGPFLQLLPGCDLDLFRRTGYVLIDLVKPYLPALCELHGELI